MLSRIKIRIFLWGLLAALTLWLIYMAIVPFGRISYSTDLKSDNYFIRKLSPAERLGTGEDGLARLLGDPVYFSLRTPRRFDQAKLTLTYRRGKGTELPIGNSVPAVPSGGMPVIEAGVMADDVVKNYALKPLDNKTIDQLALVWNVLREGPVLLLQKDKKFEAIGDFLKDLPPMNEIAVYNHGLRPGFSLPDYEANAQKQAVARGLRGPYQFYTYLGGEELDFTFSFVDMNQNRDSDPVELNLYYYDKLIDSRRLEDDGSTRDDGRQSDRRELELKLAGLPAGAYKIEVRTNDDIVTREIAATQTKLALGGRLRLTGDGRETLKFFTDATRLFALTEDPAKLQTITAGDREIVLKETYRQYDAMLSGALTEIKLERDGVTLASDGVLSFSRDALINPSYRKVNEALDINAAGIKYVIAAYEPPIANNGFEQATAEFDLSGAYRENGAYSLVLSVPGLKADDGVDDYLEISGIEIKLNGKTLWGKIREFLK